MAFTLIVESVHTIANVDNKDQYLNVLHYGIQGEIIPLNIDEICALKFNQTWIDKIAPCLNSKGWLKQTQVQTVFPLPRSSGFYVGNNPTVVGAVVGDPLPPSCALVVRKRTRFAGRKYRGRVFQGMMSESDQVNGVWTGNNSTSMMVAWEDILTSEVDLGAGVFAIPVLWGKGASSTSQAVPVTAAIGDSIVRNQRRRQVNVGT